MLERCGGLCGPFWRMKVGHSPVVGGLRDQLGPDRLARPCVGCARRGASFAWIGQIGRFWGPDRSFRGTGRVTDSCWGSYWISADFKLLKIINN